MSKNSSSACLFLDVLVFFLIGWLVDLVTPLPSSPSFSLMAGLTGFVAFALNSSASSSSSSISNATSLKLISEGVLVESYKVKILSFFRLQPRRKNG